MRINLFGFAPTRPAVASVIPARSRAGTDVRAEPIEQTLFAIYLAGLAWVPLWYGSNDLLPWGINAVLFPGLAGLYEVSLLARWKPHPVAIRELAVPAGLFLAVLAWIGVQTATWSWLPLAGPIWGMTAQALGRKIAGSISVDRDLTNLALLRLITAASAFWLALQLCRDGRRARALILSVAAIGCGYAAYGLIAAQTGQVPWLDIPATGRVTATFVNHNSFACYAGLCFIVSAGLVLRFYRRVATASGAWRHQIASFIEASGREGAVLLAGGFVIAVALLLTGSRGGLISTGIGLLVLVFLLRHRGSNHDRQPLATIAFVLVLLAATVYVFGNTVGNSLDERGLTDANRMSVYILTIRSILDAPLSGYGYGTFRDVFPMYRDHSLTIDGIWAQAHDTYLEVFQGLGLVFGTLLIACVVLLVLRCVRGARRRREGAIVPQVAVGAACVVAVHSLVDFSLQMQAIALTFMALLGAGVAQSESSRVALGD